MTGSEQDKAWLLEAMKGEAAWPGLHLPSARGAQPC